MASFGELSSNFFHPLWLVSLSDLRPNVMVPHAFDAVCAVFVSEPLPHSTRLRTSLHDELHDEASTPDQPPALLFQVVPELMYGVRCRSVRVSEQIQECRRSALNTAPRMCLYCQPAVENWNSDRYVWGVSASSKPTFACEARS